MKENNFKQTEIGLIPEDWEVVGLEEIGKIITGNTPSKKKKEYWENGEIDFIKPPDLKNSYITTFSEKISLKAKDKARIVPEKSILVSCIGIIGRVGYTLKPVAFNQQINAIIPFSDKINNLFLFFALQTQVKQIESLKSATTVPIVNKAKFSHVKIPLPPLEEQRKIAKVLDKIQQAIEIQDRIIEQAKNLKKSLMQKLFTEGLYGEEQKETEIGLIPKSWKVVRLGEVANLKSGGTPSRKINEYFGGEIPWVKSTELRDNIIYDTEEKITEVGLRNSSAKIFPKGTLLVAMYGATTGKTAILGIDAATNQAICAIFPKDKSFIEEFLKQYIIYSRSRLLSERFGGAQPNISQTILKNFKIPLPPLPEQQEIANILSTIDRKIEIEQRRKEVLKQLFKTMLHKLMSGEIRLKDIEI